MSRRYLYPLLIILITIGFYYAESYLDSRDNYPDKGQNPSEKSSFFYFPSSTTGAVVSHKNYALSYSEKHEQAEWVAYELSKRHLSNNNFKRPYFQIDKKVKTTAADWRNYKRSGYDRGHLCPAGDRRFTYDAYHETFLTSNISPQNHDFNSGIWNFLEQKTRYWAKRYDKVYVVTGGVLTDGLKSIGYESVSVPDYFYKVILDNNASNPKMIAFLMPNKNVPVKLKEYIVSVDHLEKLTGIDFFPSLDDKIENRLEASNSASGWKF